MQSNNSILSKFNIKQPNNNSQVIIWSSSDSSEYDNNCLSNETYQKIPHERVKRRRKFLRYTNSSKNDSRFDHKYDKIELDSKENCEKSPVLKQKHLSNTSDIKCSKRYSAPCEANNKPPLERRNENTCCTETKQKSPILLPKYISPKVSTKSRRKRVKSLNTSINIPKLDVVYVNSEQSFKKSLVVDQALNVGNTSPILKSSNQYFPPTKADSTATITKHSGTNYEEIRTKSPVLLPKYISSKFSSQVYKKQEVSMSRADRCVSPDLFSHNNKSNCANTDKTFIKKLTNIEFKDKMKKIISAFSCSPEFIFIESQASENGSVSNNSIENSPTEAAKAESSSKHVDSKKFNYEKGGLAFRLHELVKKQNAISCLWFHERFLGIQPKEEKYTAYKIDKVDFKYGSYLLKLLNPGEGVFYLYLNSSHVKRDTIAEDAVMRLYEPYVIIDFDSYKMIINVFKYECIKSNNF